MRPRLYLALLLRESRGARGRLTFLALCLAVGVAAVVAVAALADNLDQGLRREAKQLLGADLAFSARRPLPPALHRAVGAIAGARVVEVRELATMAASVAPPGQVPASLLVELKTLGGPYPLYGTLRSEPAAPLATLLGEDGAVLAPEALERLGLALGDPLRLGEATFTVRAVLRAEPDRAVTPFTLGPRVLISQQGFARTRLEAFGSRIGYRLLVRLPGNASREQVAATARRLRQGFGTSPWWRLETWSQAQPELRQGLRQVERFLGLVALLSLLVGGVGVAQSVRAFLASRLDAIAVMKCLGVRPREAFALYLGQCLLLALLGGVLGGLAGLAVQSQIPRLLGEVLPAQDLPFWQPRALARGLLLGAATSLLFALPPLAAVLRVPPLRALRRSAEPLPASRLVRLLSGAALLTGLLLLAYVQSRSWELALRFTAGLVGAVAALAVAGWLLRRAALALSRLRRPLLLRHGAALLARPAGESLPALVALGLGVLVVLVAALVERHLTGALAAELPKSSPSAFLIDIQPDQWHGVDQLLRREGASEVESVPVVMARLSAIDGVPVETLAARAKPGEERQGAEARERRWALTREQRLTYFDALPPDNRLVASLWRAAPAASAGGSQGTEPPAVRQGAGDGAPSERAPALWIDPALPEVSLEEEYATELGARLGSRLVFDVQGVPVEVVVTSLRAIDWRTFRINFFVLVEPGVLEAAPQTRLAAARLPFGREARIQGLLAQRYPNVTLVDIRDVLAKVTAVFQRLGLGVRFLGGFTAAAGLVILFGAVAAGAVRRAREVALLKTLGFTRGGVAGLFAVEQALTGVVAGTLGVISGALLARQIVERQMELEWRLLPGTLATALAIAVALTLAAGLGAMMRALRQRPIEALREERE